MAKKKKHIHEEEEPQFSMVQEPYVPYGSSSSFATNTTAWQLLKSYNYLNHEPLSSFDYLYSNEEGVPKASAIKVAKAMDVPLKDMAWLLNISYKTFARKKPADKLDALTSSLTIELANVIEDGINTFGSLPKFRSWLQKNNRALNGHTPFSLLNTPTGIKMVQNVLGRINEGIYT